MPAPLFTIDELLDEARTATGLDDFGPPHFREGLGVLIDALSNEAHLKPEAAARARTMISTRLEKRLRLQDFYNHHPEVLEQEVVAPIFILGSPRSGSSIMHEILSLDPANRTPQAWEVANPLPPPEAATYDTDPRIEQMQEALDASSRTNPTRGMHRVGARLPSEDVEITMLDFASVIPLVSYYVPSYSKWLYDEVDFEPVYGTLKRFMQLLQWKTTAQPWILKSLYSMHYIDAFLAAFPDARVIWLHRDPLGAMASGVKLVSMASAPSSDVVDPADVARDTARWSVAQHDRSVDVQERHLLPDDRLFNVRFPEFVADHVAMVKRIYDHFGMELRPEVERKMRDYVGGNPAERHNPYEEDLIRLGLDPAEYRKKFQRYQNYFDIGNDH